MKKILAFVIFTVLLSLSASAFDEVVFSKDAYKNLAASSSDVVAVQKDGKCGVIDLDGKVVVPFEYDSILVPDRNGNTVAYKIGDSGKRVDSFVFTKNGKLAFSIEGAQVLSCSDSVIIVAKNPRYDEEGQYIYTAEHYSMSGKKLFELDEVIAQTDFCEGYAAAVSMSGTVIVDRSGKSIYTDTSRLLPLSVCSDGRIIFSGIEEGDELNYYIVDINTRERISIVDYPNEGETNFDKVQETIDGFSSFVPIVNEDGNIAFSVGGKSVIGIEDPETYSVCYYAYKNGIKGSAIEKATLVFSGEKYFMVSGYEKNYYCDMNGVAQDFEFEAATTFSDGKAIAITDDGELFFINEDFERISEYFTDVYAVGVSGKVFWAYNNEKFYVLSLEKKSDPAPTPVTPPIETEPEQNVSGMDNFIKINTYSDKVFSDVTTSHWYRANVALAYETGLMYGKENGFDAQSNITLAQVITMAARLHSIYHTGKAEFVQGKVWYQVYVDYCVDKGIISKNEFSDYNKDATRAQFVRILSKSVPQAEFEVKNSISAVPDVASNHKDSGAILMFYKAGILAGSDSAHNFFPERSITRAETAAIVTRIIDKTLRLSF